MDNDLLSSRWIPSRYSGAIYHATLPNYKREGFDIIMELEGSDNRVYPSIRLASEHIEVGDSSGYPSYSEASRACLEAVQVLFQARRKSSLICEYFPYQKDREIKHAYGVSQQTAWNWRHAKFAMARMAVNQILVSMGFRFIGRGKNRRVELHTPAWEPDDMENNSP